LQTAEANNFFLTQDATQPEEESRPYTSNTLPEGAQSPNYRVSNKQPKKNKSMALLKSRVMPSPFAENSSPGPGQYHVTGSLVKPTFNRVYSEPVCELEPSYLRPTASRSNIHLTDSSLVSLLSHLPCLFPLLKFP